MSGRITLFVIAVSCSILLYPQSSGEVSFVSPLSGIPSLSASFAELRSDHFHSGLDYRTGGVQGREVLAVDEGYVYRVGVSPGGFGKALYVRHPSGYTSVYAHLRSFRPDIEEYVKENQYRSKSFTVSLFPGKNQFTVSRSEVIAWSGNSGSSTGPHLHFEIRDSATEEPVNPLTLGFEVKDTRKPVIEKVVIYPISRSSAVNNSHQKLTLRTAPGDGSYRLAADAVPVIYGETGIGIKCWDTFDNSNNRCGAYTIDLYADGMRVFGWRADRFSYGETRYINAHIDYEAKATTGENIQRLYIQPGDRLSMYDGHLWRGVLRFNDNSEHEIKVVVSDAHNNISTVAFRVKAQTEPPLPPFMPDYTRMIPWGRADSFTAEGLRVNFPAGALYDTLWLRYSTRRGTSRHLAPIHSVHDERVALHARPTLSVRPDTIITGMEGKLSLARINRKGTLIYAGGTYKDGYVTGQIGSLGDYTVAIDTIPPTASFSFAGGADLSGRSLLTATIRDDFSGIKSYDIYIDGQWALAEYDSKNNLLIYRPDKNYISDNRLHEIELRVSDNADNLTIVRSTFRW